MRTMIEHQEKTNGRVAECEKKILTHDKAIWMAGGGIVVIQFLVNIVF